MKKRMLSLLLCLCLFAGLLPAASLPAAAAGPDAFIRQSGVPMPTSQMNAIAWGAGAYVAVGYYGAIVRSADGVHWAGVRDESSLPEYGLPSQYLDGSTTFVFSGAAWGAGLFVVTGDSGVILTSPDGLVWTKRVCPVTEAVTEVKYLTLNGVSAFYALSRGCVLTSADGISWTKITTPAIAADAFPTEITVGQNGTQLAVGMQDGADGWYQGKIVTSADGVSWAAAPRLSYGEYQYAGSINMLQWMNDRYFISDLNAYVWTSADLQTFTRLGDPFKTSASDYDNQFFNGFYAQGRYFLFGSQTPGGYGAVLTSPDAAAWTLQPDATGFVTQNSQYLNGMYFRLGNEGLMYSADGNLWNYGWGETFFDVVWDGAKYVAAGRIGADGGLWTSPDLKVWSRVTLPRREPTLYAVAFGGGRYVAAGENNIYHKKALLTSANGTDWTALDSDYTTVSDLAFGSGLFVAAGRKESAPCLRTSPDGVTWTAPVLPGSGATGLWSVEYAGGSFLLTGYDDKGGSYLWSSADGVTWSAQNLDALAGEYLISVTRVGETYVMLSYSAADWMLFTRTSRDLISWSAPAAVGGAYTNGSGAQMGALGGRLYVLGTMNSRSGLFFSENMGASWLPVVTDSQKDYLNSLSAANERLLLTGTSGLVLSAGPAARAPSVAVGAQSGALNALSAGTATFAVTTADFTNNDTLGTQNYTVTWYTDAAGTAGASAQAPAGLTLNKTGAGLLTLAADASVQAGSYCFRLTVTDSDTAVPETAVSAAVAVQVSKIDAPAGMKTVSVQVSELGAAGAAAALPALPAGASFGSPSAAGELPLTGLSVSGGTLTFTAAAGTPGQTGTVTIPVTGAANYSDYSVTVTVTSAARTPVVLGGLGAADGVYTGSPAAGVTGTPTFSPAGCSGPLEYVYYLAGGTVKTTPANSGAAAEGAAPVGAGSYRVVVSIPENDPDYTGSAAFDFTVAKAAAVLTAAPGQSKVYDGAAVTAGASGADLLYAYTGDGAVSATFYADSSGARGGEITAPSAAGTYWVGLSASAGANYEAAAETVQKFTIAAANAAVTVGAVPDAVYTARQIRPAVTVSAGGTVLAENADYTLEYGENRNAGTGSVTVRAVPGGNYLFENQTQTFTIVPAPLTVTPANGDKLYGLDDPPLTFTTAGWQGADGTDLLTGALARAPGENAGSYAVTAGTLSAGGNYALRLTGAELAIFPAPVFLGVSVSPAAARPGKTVILTVTACNPLNAAPPAGVLQPSGVTLQTPSGAAVLTPVAGRPGVFTAVCTVPQTASAGSELTFTAAVADVTGNYLNPPAQSAVLRVTEKGPVTLTLTADKTAGVLYGDSVVFTAEVGKADPVADLLSALEGTVSFYLGDPASGELLAVRTLGAGGLTVTLDPARLTCGVHTVTAVYSGSAEFGAAQRSLSVTVGPRVLRWDTAGLSSTKPFDGKPDAPFTGELKVAGAVGSDEPGFTYDKTATTAAYADANAGAGKTAAVRVAGAALANPNYALPAEAPVFAGTILPIKEVAPPAEPEPHGYRLKLELSAGLGAVPAELTAADPALDTPAAVENRLRLTLAGLPGLAGAGVKSFELTLWFSRDDGVTWQKATADNFPEDGITVTLPWSELGLTCEQALHTRFAVVHLFVSAVRGHVPGTTETPAWTVTPQGLRFTLTGLSPVAVAAVPLPFITFDAAGGSGTAGAYTAVSGKLYGLPLPARGGYAFDGWYTAASGGSRITADTVFGADATVFAHWTASASAPSAPASPKTGVGAGPALWLGLAAAALLGFAALRRRKRRA